MGNFIVRIIHFILEGQTNSLVVSFLVGKRGLPASHGSFAHVEVGFASLVVGSETGVIGSHVGLTHEGIANLIFQLLRFDTMFTTAISDLIFTARLRIEFQTGIIHSFEMLHKNFRNAPVVGTGTESIIPWLEVVTAALPEEIGALAVVLNHRILFRVVHDALGQSLGTTPHAGQTDSIA